MTDSGMEQNSAATKQSIEAAAAALKEIRNRSFSGRHPDLGRMINCPFCGLRHREHDNGRDKPCEQTFAIQNGVHAIAGKTPSTTPEFLYDGDVQRKQARLLFGARLVKGKRKTPRNRLQQPLSFWRRVLIEKENKNG